MARKKPNTNPKKRNRYTSAGLIRPGIKKVRDMRTKLIAAQKRGEPEEKLNELRDQLKKLKAVAKKAE